LSAAVEREVVQLPARERQLFDLRFRKRRSLQKVAAALGISKATAGRWCRALRDRLRRNLAEQGYVETRPRAAELRSRIGRGAPDQSKSLSSR
jgi:DNA-directed RNA polymerase specialized sigma24 family protein